MEEQEIYEEQEWESMKPTNINPSQEPQDKLNRNDRNNSCWSQKRGANQIFLISFYIFFSSFMFTQSQSFLFACPIAFRIFCSPRN